jgi:hypothetical protein
MSEDVNPELISTVPTHTYKGTKVKVFMSTYHVDEAHHELVTFEYMDGEHKGKWGNASLHNLDPIVVDNTSQE